MGSVVQSQIRVQQLSYDQPPTSTEMTNVWDICTAICIIERLAPKSLLRNN